MRHAPRGQAEAAVASIEGFAQARQGAVEERGRQLGQGWRRGLGLSQRRGQESRASLQATAIAVPFVGEADQEGQQGWTKSPALPGQRRAVENAQVGRGHDHRGESGVEGRTRIGNEQQGVGESARDVRALVGIEGYEDEALLQHVGHGGVGESRCLQCATSRARPRRDHEGDGAARLARLLEGRGVERASVRPGQRRKEESSGEEEAGRPGRAPRRSHGAFYDGPPGALERGGL